MIYRREEYFEEAPENQKFPVKQIEQIVSLDGQVRKYVGRVSLGIQTPMGVSTIPVSFEIEAANVEEAFRKFEQIAEVEIERAKDDLQKELQEMRRQSQNRIVTPGDIHPGELGKLQL